MESKINLEYLNMRSAGYTIPRETQFNEKIAAE